jgi:RNA polymerase sigma factor (sigma-70 family)
LDGSPGSGRGPLVRAVLCPERRKEPTFGVAGCDAATKAEAQEATRDGLETNEAERSTVVQLLRTLPYRQRQVLVLRYFVDLTKAQIAYELGVSPGSVKTHASRGLAALARALDGSR